MWTEADLTIEELTTKAMGGCDCQTPQVTGTRNGYRCASHRASDELMKRQANEEER